MATGEIVQEECDNYWKREEEEEEDREEGDCELWNVCESELGWSSLPKEDWSQALSELSTAFGCFRRHVQLQTWLV